MTCILCQVPAVSVNTESNSAVNEIRWNPTGTQIAAGDDAGRVHVFDVGEVCHRPSSVIIVYS